MPVSVINNLFHRAAVLRATGKGDVSVSVTLVGNTQAGACFYADGTLIYHDAWFGKVGQFELYHPPSFSTASNLPLSEILSQFFDPHTNNPPQLLPPFDQRSKTNLALSVTADGVVRYYRPQNPKEVRTFIASQVGLTPVIYGVGLPSHPPVKPPLEELAPLLAVSFRDPIYTPPPA
jgi:hypothetical protein